VSNPKLLYPAAVYIAANSLGVPQIALPFVYPPQAVPAYSIQRTAHKNLASSGVREVIVERIDNFTDLNMHWVVAGMDVANWNQFWTNCVLVGLPFDLYPDASLSSFTPYRIENGEWKAVYGSGKSQYAGIFHFTARLRAWIAP
jgi:hypothetical protein